MFGRSLFAALIAVAVLTCTVTAAPDAGLKAGTPDIKSAGPLAFGPDGILFVGDPQGAAIFAFDTGDTKKAAGHITAEGIDTKIGAMLGTDAKGILINDMAVNPISGNVYFSVSRGKGPDAVPVIVKLDRSGKLEEYGVKTARFGKATLPNPPASGGRGRTETITDIAFVNGRVFVAGLSNEEFASKLRSIPFPFTEADAGTSVEIFHGAHGKFETNAPVRTFATYKFGGEDHLLAAYTCTPLVRFPVGQLKPGDKVKGTTIAELGNRNRPLDMIIYTKEGKDFILMANSSRGVMKVPLEGADKAEGITTPVRTEKAGHAYEVVEKLKGVEQLDKLDANHAVILVRGEGGALNLQTIHMP